MTRNFGEEVLHLLALSALIALNIAIAWGIYLGAKQIAALLVASQIDQAVMAALAVALTYAVDWKLRGEGD